MEAPEKIYVSTDPFGFLHAYDCENHPPIVEEYIRKDAFINKACELINRLIWEVTYEDLEGNSVQHYDKMEFIEDFRKAMKGE